MRLTASVGQGGRNLSGDVLYVQILLADWLLVNKNTSIPIDALMGPKTIDAIRQFQVSNTAVVDVLIEPNRSTIRALETKHISSLESSIRLTLQTKGFPRLVGGDASVRLQSSPPLVDAYLRMLRGKD
jgi:hypothetical protein